MKKLSRRNFIKISAVSPLILSNSLKGKTNMKKVATPKIRLGGPVFEEIKEPRNWVMLHKKWEKRNQAFMSIT